MLKIIILCILLLSSQVFAGIHRFENIISLNTGDDVTRSYVYTSTKNGFTLAGASINGTISKGNTNATVDSSVFSFNTGFSFPSFIWAYYHGVIQGGPFDVSGSAFASAFMPTYIIEYVETNNVTGFQQGGDQIVGWVNLGKLEYDVTETSEQLTNPDTDKNFTIYHVSATSSTGLYQMNFTVSDSPVSINGTIDLSSEQAKIDIGIFNYYNSTINPKSSQFNCILGAMNCASTGPSNNQSSLALASFFAALDYDLDANGPNRRISVNNNGGFHSGFNAGFDWVGNARVSHQNGTINYSASVHSNCTSDDGGSFGSSTIPIVLGKKTSHKFLIYSFEGVRPQSLIWDPTMGANLESSSSSSNKVISTFSLFISFILFVLLI